MILQIYDWKICCLLNQINTNFNKVSIPTSESFSEDFKVGQAG